MEEFEVFVSEVNELIEKKQYVKLRQALEELNPADIAALFENLNAKETILVYRILPKELASEVFVYIDTDKAKLLIKSFSDYELKEVISDLFLDDTVDIIEEMPANVVARILQAADPAVRQQINELLKYPEDSAGSVMTVEYVSLPKNYTVAEAFKKIRKESIDKETVYTCYVTENRRLLGTVSVKDLLLANEDAVVGEIMETNVIYVDAYEDKEIVAQTFSKYDVLALPVVDHEQRIVGIITVDDALDVMEAEATEDIEKMAAITSTDRPYLKTGVFNIWLNRIPWLLLLMLSATFTGSIISSFEDALTAFPVLVAYIPMLMGTGGNAGGQSSVTVIRGIAVGEIQIKDYFKIIFKELRVSLICGIVLAAANVLRMKLFSPDAGNLEILVVSLAMLCAIVVAKLIGCSLPIFAKIVKLDPALMAGPMIATLVDIVTLAIYFILAQHILDIV